MRVLFIGEIVGRKGREAVANLLPRLRHTEQLDFVIANANKVDRGFAVIAEDVERLTAAGVDVLTLGDNCFKKKATVELLGRTHSVLRPVNASYLAPGEGFAVKSAQNGILVGVISAFGRTNFRNPVLENPFLAVRKALRQINEKTKVAILDFHCNATSEKQAMARFLSGKIAAVIGTHLGVQTADLEVDGNGTAFLCDVGLVGSGSSIGGYQPDKIIEAFQTSMRPHKVVKETDYIFNSILLEIDEITGRSSSARALNFALD